MPKSDIATQSYIWENNSILKEKRQLATKQNYMPFLFRSKRQGSVSKQQTPSVGSYQISSTFSQNNSKSQPDFIKKKLQHQNQMNIFKSNQQRFKIDKNYVPGPASYDCVNNDFRTKFVKINDITTSKKFQQKMNLLKRSPSCPTIPDSKVKFGYVRDKQGNYKLIEKSANQIEKQKLKLKQYLTTLDGQNQFMKRLEISHQPYLSQQNKRQQAILSNLEKFVNRRSTSSSNLLSVQNHTDFIKLVKPKVILSHGANVKKQNQDHLGPGCYDVDLDTLKKGKKNQNFQFFSSSEIRFAPIVKQNPINPYEYLFNQKRNLQINEKIQGKIYKKSFPTSPIDHVEKEQLPGPGYYDPQVQRVKKAKVNVRFGSEQRFKENIKDTYEFDEQERQNIFQQKQSKMIWGNLKKDKIKSPHKAFSPVRQSQIYGIMNQEPSTQNTSSLKQKFNAKKNKQSAVFLDKSQRLNLTNKTYNNGEIQSNIDENPTKLWDTKGSFMSKLPKKYLELKQETPGPGTYQKLSLDKKSFNIKNQ